MKKILFLCLLIMPFVFTSCGNEGDDPSNPKSALVGTWHCIDSSNDECFIQFKSDGTGEDWWMLWNNTRWDITPFKWYIKDNNILCIELEDEYGYYFEMYYKISNGKLTFTHIKNDNGWDEYEWTRK